VHKFGGIAALGRPYMEIEFATMISKRAPPIHSVASVNA
jgi:hypothetical protein